jgi:transformation/transcription domain-associated protein
MNKDDPILLTMKKLRKLTDVKGQVVGHSLMKLFSVANNCSQKYTDQSNMRMEAYTTIQDTMVPNTIVLEYFTKSFTSFTEFWLFRRQFSYQFAALTFMTYTMHMNNRYPHKLSIARSTGNIWGSELIPAMAAGKAFFHNPEPVPFRLSPNIQTLMGPIAMEGIFSCAVMAIARCLTEPEFELEQQLSIFVRDEMNFWYRQQHRSGPQESQSKLRESVAINSEIIVKKAVSLARPPEGVNLPASQTVIDLISRAVNPMNLAQSDALWMPYL